MKIFKLSILILFLISIFVHLNFNFTGTDFDIDVESNTELNEYSKNCDSESQTSYISLGKNLNAQGTICFNCENGEENPVVCYATFSSCGWGDNCSTFYRCNPNGDCYSTSGKDMIDSSHC